jgi:hypothetical protein
MFPRLSPGGGGGGDDGEPDVRIRPDPIEIPCNSENPTLNSAEEFLNELLDQSNFSEFRAAREHYTYGGVEQSGFILPDGSTINLGSIGALRDQTACDFWFNEDVMSTLTVPAGTIWVQVHPWSDGDDQVPACGMPDSGPRREYEPGPGTKDAAALGALLQFYEVEIIGVVIDGDQITVFDEDGHIIEEVDRCY